MSQQTHDLAHNCPALSSIAPITNAAATVTGTYVDCAALIGPIQAIVHTGAATGTPDASSVVYTLMESDASDGTGATAVSGATATHTGANISQLAGQRACRYVAVKAVVTFTNGTSPKIPVSGILINPRVRSA